MPLGEVPVGCLPMIVHVVSAVWWLAKCRQTPCGNGEQDKEDLRMIRKPLLVRQAAPVVSVLAASIMAGCSESVRFVDGGNIQPTATEFTNPVTVSFVGIDGTLLDDTDITFTLSGGQADELFLAGADLEDDSYVTSTGTVLLNRSADSSINEFEITLTATATDYFGNGAVLVFPAESDLADGEASPAVTIYMTPYSPTTTDLGITTVEDTFTIDSTGLTTSAVTIVTAIPASTSDNFDEVANGSAQIEIPSGTSLLDADGTALTGTITANLVYFSNEPNGSDADPSALEAFPGGFAPTSILNSSGDVDSSYADAVFISGGFVGIVLTDESGTTVSSFSEDVTLTFTVSSDTINPDTDAAIAAGETIPLWSYSSSTGLWTAEGDATVGTLDTSTDTYTVTATTDHLSYYNLDYIGTRCDATITFNDSSGLTNYNPTVSFVRDGGGWLQKQVISTITEHTFYSLPAENSGTFTVESSGGTDLISSVSLANGTSVTVTDSSLSDVTFCELDGATITLDSSSVTLNELSVSLESICSDSDTTTAQAGVAYIYSSSPFAYLGTVIPNPDEAGVLELENGTYDVYGYLVTEDLGSVSTNSSVTIDDAAASLTLCFD